MHACDILLLVNFVRADRWAVWPTQSFLHIKCIYKCVHVFDELRLAVHAYRFKTHACMYRALPENTICRQPYPGFITARRGAVKTAAAAETSERVGRV